MLPQVQQLRQAKAAVGPHAPQADVRGQVVPQIASGGVKTVQKRRLENRVATGAMFGRKRAGGVEPPAGV